MKDAVRYNAPAQQPLQAEQNSKYVRSEKRQQLCRQIQLVDLGQSAGVDHGCIDLIE